jgi:AbiV family abortive infection protein
MSIMVCALVVPATARQLDRPSADWSMQPLPLEHIEAGRLKLVANARDLIAEATLLFERGHFPRAYALAHLASEELAKLPMYVRAGVDATLGHSVDWKRLKKKVSSHTRKLDALHTLDYFFSEVRADNSDIAAYAAALDTTPSLNDRKNASLYVSVTPEGTQAPSEAIDKNTAAVMLERANKVFAFFSEAERKTAGKIRALTKSPTTARLFEVMQEFEAGKFD